jgi:hypothetical protein
LGDLRNPDLDGRRLNLEQVIAAVVGTGIGTILSCIPGRLAFFEGEDQSLLLAK